MDSFHWDSNFETGLTAVDHQHRHLVDMVNQFGSLLAENDVQLFDVEKLFTELAEYAIYHFKEEEALMEKLSVDQRHFERHVEVHNGFLQEVTMLHDGISEDSPESAKHLFDFLTHWLVYHILGDDQNMARQIKAIESGIHPVAAFEQGEKERDASTGPLLHALDNLFEQVSARNKELVKLNQSLEEKVAQRTKELSEANKHLEEISLTDVLTGLPNRRHAMRRLETFWNESLSSGKPLVCMMIDADHFKEVNDTYGHDAGDDVLTELARTLKHAMRNDDVVCRLGGDEFFVICPDTNLDGGMHIAEVARKNVAEMRVPTGDGFWHGSISVGVAVSSQEMAGFEELIKEADKGVYAAKQAGKNCVRSA